jgi:8-oxo-dGTP diphosphatase
MQKLSHEEYYKSLSKKRMGSSVIFFDENGKLLVVKPNYKDGWLMPGGSVDAEESPMHAGVREVKEEIGLDIENPKLVCVHYLKAVDEIVSETVQYVFFGGVLNKDQISKIVLQTTELDEYRFVSVEESLTMLRSNLKYRLPFSLDAIKNSTVAYIES